MLHIQTCERWPLLSPVSLSARNRPPSPAALASNLNKTSKLLKLRNFFLQLPTFRPHPTFNFFGREPRASKRARNLTGEPFPQNPPTHLPTDQHVAERLRRLARRRRRPHPEHPRSGPASLPLPSVEEGCQRGHQDPQSWCRRSRHPRRRHRSSCHPPPHPSSLRGQERRLHLRSLQDGSRSRLRCLPRRHRRFHHHKRGLRPHGPDPRSQGQGRETDDLSFSFTPPRSSRN
ncbi:hypothetical protein D6C83_03147 [Aureobasidium pullulans]|uniref:Uncharacterized protein n=1 Tax=Aureobasidium pullulans TaxID=5580 RepID=A0A4T0DQ85_AURPU|nr:hypothetical protein D6C83_03147 [Aureobasidium pullulans]